MESNVFLHKYVGLLPSIGEAPVDFSEAGLKKEELSIGELPEEEHEEGELPEDLPASDKKDTATSDQGVGSSSLPFSSKRTE